jgi:hypothetical protein
MYVEAWRYALALIAFVVGALCARYAHLEMLDAWRHVAWQREESARVLRAQQDWFREKWTRVHGLPPYRAKSHTSRFL